MKARWWTFPRTEYECPKKTEHLVMECRYSTTEPVEYVEETMARTNDVQAETLKSHDKI